MFKYTKVFLLITIVLSLILSSNLGYGQDKRERKAQEALQEREGNREQAIRDSLMRRHYKSQSKEVRKRMKKAYKAARRNHEGKRMSLFKRIANNRRKKQGRKARRKK